MSFSARRDLSRSAGNSGKMDLQACGLKMTKTRVILNAEACFVVKDLYYVEILRAAQNDALTVISSEREKSFFDENKISHIRSR